MINDSILKIELARLDFDVAAPQKDYNGKMPRRSLFLRLNAWLALEPIIRSLVLTDLYRSLAGSLEALKRKRGVQRPGKSAHNFGLALDADVEAVLRGLALPSKPTTKSGLDDFMLAHGWRCFRDDHDPGASESWHFTWGATAGGSEAVEAAILRNFPKLADATWLTDPYRAQSRLQKLGLYHGLLDGDFGPQSRTALEAFQRTWELPADGALTGLTPRTLAVASADKRATVRVDAAGNRFGHDEVVG